MKTFAYHETQDTIVALSTAVGKAAIALIRLSGENAFSIIEKHFLTAKGDKIDISSKPSHTLHFGTFITSQKEIIDEVLISIFKNPSSFTGEDMIEISCHGSEYIQQKIVENLVMSGARLALPGEFSFRAFKNQKIDLSQAEAIADLISAESESAHKIALDQMRGNYSSRLDKMRQQVIHLLSLLELELDFAEEDVEFADRTTLRNAITQLLTEVEEMMNSFKLGNVIKKGIPVAIVGKPNVGKSTLLNLLLQEEKAIVSNIPGTTRDFIEDTVHIQGISFRFIDTAGLRSNSEDEIEILGIERTHEKINEATIVLYVFDSTEITKTELNEVLEEFKEIIENPEKVLILIGNKIDMLEESPKPFVKLAELETIYISAKRNENIQLVIDKIVENSKLKDIKSDAIVSNLRHFEELSAAHSSLKTALVEMDNNTPSDLLAIPIRAALQNIAEITGAIAPEDVLNNVFSHFCIGK